MTASPVIPPHPLDRPGVVKIMLGQLASDAVAALGEHCLVITSKADGTAPEGAQGRMILHCLPWTQDALNAAYRVASGSHRATRIKVKPSPSAPLTPKQLRTA